VNIVRFPSSFPLPFPSIDYNSFRFPLPRILAVHCSSSSHRHGTTDVEGHSCVVPVPSAYHHPFAGGHLPVHGEHLGVCSLPTPACFFSFEFSLFAFSLFSPFRSRLRFLTLLIATTDNPLLPFRNWDCNFICILLSLLNKRNVKHTKKL
jgi:hypothetical protein